MTISVKDAAGVTRTVSTSDDLIAPIEAIGSVNELIAPLEAIGSVDELIVPVNKIGTRGYNYAAVQRIAFTGTAIDSAPITATEIMVTANVKCYILPGASGTATNANSIPIEAGEKFHLRITSGHKISVIRDLENGFLQIVPIS